MARISLRLMGAYASSPESSSGSPLTSSFSTTTMFRISRLPLCLRGGSSVRRGLATATAQLPSQSHGHLPTSQSPITPKLQFFNSVMEDGKQIPTYRVLDGAGKVIEGAELPEVCPRIFGACSELIPWGRLTRNWHGECKSASTAAACVFISSRYQNMVKLPIIDTLLYNVQRQGKISFYVRILLAVPHHQLTAYIR